ncbi:WhiB family transcriptional regulator [Mycobacterium sp. P7213]|uniref:WhiB family transcriptional regulator n=1 Tax=Mycobacterium sp. P7213 TaxID=2478465 RepID=UPI0013DE102A|nr:WhiB family transcriptional regulator [Mycobacterium sp. P7213]
MSAPWVELLAKVLAGVPKLPEAACRSHLALFDAAADGDRQAAEQAVTVCEACPVLAACGEWIATARRPPPGVTAGKYTPTKEPKEGKK